MATIDRGLPAMGVGQEEEAEGLHQVRVTSVPFDQKKSSEMKSSKRRPVTVLGLMTTQIL
jgi:hypothetical protein